MVVSNNGVDAGVGRVGFMYGATRSVVFVEPCSGPKEGGTIVTVTGSNLDAGATRTECIFGAHTVSGIVRNASTVVCTAPVSASGEVTVSLRQDGLRLEGGLTFEYFEAPTVESITPSRGPSLGGVIVSVRGANLKSEGLMCRFGATAVSGAGARLVTSTVVACVAPTNAGREGKVNVEVSVNEGIDFSSNGKEFVYGAMSVVEGVKPSQVMGGVAGQVVTVIGRDFAQTPELQCRFGLNATLAGRYVTSSRVTCTVPMKDSGAVTVSIADGATTGAALLSYADLGARILSSSPTRGALSGGTSVMIAVQELDLTPDEVIRCQFGEGLVGGKVVDASTVQCRAPAGATEGSVVVRLQRGSNGLYLRGAGVFEYIMTPAVRDVQPSRGPEAGGRSVSVFGVGFLRGEVVCRFGSQVMPVSGAAWLSSTHVTCTSPSSMRGTVAVEVSMNGGADFTGSGVEYMYEQGIRISGLRPSEGRADKGGQTVTVIGEGFPRAGGLSCWFGMHQRTRAYYVSDTAVLCTSTGMQAGTVMVRVTRDDDSGDGGGLPYHVLSSRAGVAGVRPTAGANRWWDLRDLDRPAD